MRQKEFSSGNFEPYTLMRGREDEMKRAVAGGSLDFVRNTVPDAFVVYMDKYGDWRRRQGSDDLLMLIICDDCF